MKRNGMMSLMSQRKLVTVVFLLTVLSCKTSDTENSSQSKNSQLTSPSVEDKKLAQELLESSPVEPSVSDSPQNSHEKTSKNSNLENAESKPKGIAESEVRVWIFKEDGSKSCEGMGEPLKAMEAQLVQSGIKVYSSKKSTDQKMHIQMCGAPTGKGYSFEISAKDLSKAVSMGFQKNQRD